LRGLGARLAQHEFAQRLDQARRLGDWDEAAGRHDPAAGGVPAQECLDADDRPGREVDLRLVVDGELATL
jgi:predicted TPR repeat methyltransferase